jgi:hypothetical protein
MVRTNIERDEKLLDEAMKLTNKKKMLEIEGAVAWTGNLDEIWINRV